MSTAILLGSGTSVGVPVIGCDCAVCKSDDPRNVRTRCGLFVQSPQTSFLIDSGPDLREQALREDLRHLDAVLYTHAHLDHVAGFDELRAFCWHRDDPLPLHAGPDTFAALQRMFPWAMENTQRSYVRPAVHVIDGPFPVGDVEAVPVPVEHAGVETLGFRLNLPEGRSLAYLSDVKSIPETSLELLAGLDVLVLDALRPAFHPTHMSLAESLEVVARLQPAQAVFTHLGHEIDYASVSATLPGGVTLARDGLRLLFREDEPCAMLHPSIPASAT